MKNKSMLNGLMVMLAIGVLGGCIAHAQETNPGNPGTTFVNSVEQYFTDINTNYTFIGVKLELSSGYKQVTGANAASELYAQYNLTENVDVMGNFQFSGVGSAVNAAEGGIGYALINHYDLKLQGDLLLGWDNTRSDGQSWRDSFVIEPRLALKKKLTPNTYAETAVSLPFFTVGKMNTQPSFYIGVGFTY